MGLRRWELTDRDKNTVILIGPSKTQVKKLYRRMGMLGIIETVKDLGPVESGAWDLKHKVNEKEFKPVEPIKVAGKPGPNKPCHCGSGKKYKRCHGAVGRTRAKATVPLVQLPPVPPDSAGGEDSTQAACTPEAAPADKASSPDGE